MICLLAVLLLAAYLVDRIGFMGFDRWVISVNGSPPRGNLFVDDYQAILLGPKPKVLRGKELEVVLRFRDQHLTGRAGPITFAAVQGSWAVTNSKSLGSI